MATKTSILLLYLSLSKGNKIFRYATLITLAIVNLAGVALTFLNIFQCRPLWATFATPAPTSASCLDIVTLYLSSAPVNIITDLAIVFLPMPILTAMRLPRKQKTILVVTFGFGFFVAVVDVIRIVYLQGASIQKFEELNSSRSSGSSGTNQRNATDISWYASFSYMWSAVEVNVGIMCANVPGLKPLVSRFMPYILRDKVERSRSTNPDGEKIASTEMVGGRVAPTVPIPPPDLSAEQAESSPGAQSSTRNETQDDAIDMLDFLTTPDMAELPPNLQRQHNTKNVEARPPDRSPATFFDFVTIERKKSMVKMTNQESLFPIMMVNILFFLWGVAYGFLDTLNSKFQKVARMTQGQTIGIHSAYFGAYSVGSLVLGRYIFKSFGFKACYMAGLVIYACGVLVFWPSAVLTSFPAFLISNFIVGLGLSLLEIAANPFVALCGPPQWMELRLNVAQGVQAIGTVVSPLLASKVLFKGQSALVLVDVQWTYLGIALFTVLLAVAYYYVPLPEATDDELEEAAEHPDLINLTEIRGTRLVLITLAFGTLSQFCYVGAQEALSTTFPQYLRSTLLLNVDSTEFLAIGHSTFAAGRFIAAFLNLFIKPRYLLLFFYCGALVCSILAMKLSHQGAEGVVLALYFCEGPIFSLIYAITLRGLGRFTKDGAALITGAICGGGVFPPILFGVAHGDPAQFASAYRVIVAAFVIGSLYPIYLNAFPLTRRMADPVKEVGLPEVSDTIRRPSNGSARPSTGTEIVNGPKLTTIRLGVPTPPAVSRNANRTNG
jgi:fucose permease